MKSKEQIQKDVMNNEAAPSDYNLLEIYCFLGLKRLMQMYYNKQISKENATKNKMLILADYEKKYKDFEFWTSIYKEHIQSIKDTEDARTKLHKSLKEDEVITNEKLCDIFINCMEIISKVFKRRI